MIASLRRYTIPFAKGTFLSLYSYTADTWLVTEKKKKKKKNIGALEIQQDNMVYLEFISIVIRMLFEV